MFSFNIYNSQSNSQCTMYRLRSRDGARCVGCWLQRQRKLLVRVCMRCCFLLCDHCSLLLGLVCFILLKVVHMQAREELMGHKLGRTVRACFSALCVCMCASALVAMFLCFRHFCVRARVHRMCVQRLHSHHSRQEHVWSGRRHLLPHGAQVIRLTVLWTSMRMPIRCCLKFVRLAHDCMTC